MEHILDKDGDIKYDEDGDPLYMDTAPKDSRRTREPEINKKKSAHERASACRKSAPGPNNVQQTGNAQVDTNINTAHGT